MCTRFGMRTNVGISNYARTPAFARPSWLIWHLSNALSPPVRFGRIEPQTIAKKLAVIEKKKDKRVGRPLSRARNNIYFAFFAKCTNVVGFIISLNI